MPGSCLLSAHYGQWWEAMGWRFSPSGFARQFGADAETLFCRRLRGGPSLPDRALALDRIAGSLFLLCIAAFTIWLPNQIPQFNQLRISLLSRAAQAYEEIERSNAEAARPISVAEMRAVQRRLKALRYDPGAIDGRAGPSTLSALNQYRASKLMSPVSYIDRTTVADLLK